MSRKYTLVSGAFKNLGDFLISEKSKEMIDRFLKPASSLILKRIEDFEPHLSDINDTDAIIICGGPGYNTRFYGGVYPFLNLSDRITVPIIPLGLGWRGYPLYHPERFQFSAESVAAIRRIHKGIANSSTRDEMTRQILARYGVANVINTGCPTLFDFEKIEKKTRFRIPSDVEQIAVSMAQKPLLHGQNLQLLESLREAFPKSGVVAVFHRGIDADKYTSKKEGTALRSLVKTVKSHGFETIDAAYNLASIKVYDDIDFHVGYRVHAHAYCVSQRVPTFLLWEDGRGQAMSQTLQLPGIRARNEAIIDSLPVSTKVRHYLAKGEQIIRGEPGPNRSAISQMMQMIHNQIDNGFEMFEHTPQRIDKLFSRLQLFFQSNEKALYS
ncbi:MAG: polysaccharide pyruvyl transferase family protein [Candidatus Thorarchaeota archaeon]